MNMNGDEGFVFSPFHCAQVFGGHVDKSVKKVQKGLIGFGHNFTVITSIGQGFLWISCPDHLDP